MSNKTLNERNYVVADKLMMLDIDDIKKAEEELKHRLLFEKMIIDVSQKFAAALPSEVDDVIKLNLKDISKFVEVDSCCIYLFSLNDIVDVAYCWEKNKKYKKLHESFKKNARPWFSKMIEVAETIYVPDVIKLPKECKIEKRIWQKQGIRSLLVVPLVYTNKRIGFICFESIGKVKIWQKNDITLLLTIGEMVVGALARKRADEEQYKSTERFKKVLLQAIQAVAQMIEIRDPYTAGHQHRVASLATAIAEEMKLSKHQIEGLKLAALIHDIGKVYVPAELLSRSGILTENEFSIVKEHPLVGYEIIKDIEFPWPIGEIILNHHERLNGSGYPNGLKKNQICIEAKILAIADVVEAMMSHRPYRPALGIDAALREIRKGKGKFFDSEAVNACIKLFKKKNFKFEE